MKLFKGVLVLFFAIFVTLSLFGCGNNSPNSAVFKNVEKTLNRAQKALNQTQTIQNDDIVAKEIVQEYATTEAFLPVAKQTQNFQFARPFGYSNTQAMRNVNTYKPNPANRNVNSYFGYGETNQSMYNDIDYAQYGNNFGNYQNAYNFGGTFQNPAYGYGNQYQNGFAGNNFAGGIWGNNYRGISNVNTYGYGISNVNTYKNALNTENQLENEAKNNSNINTYGNSNTQQQGADYNMYETDKYLEEQFNELSNVLSSASSVLNVNTALKIEKDYIENSIKILKEKIKVLKKNKEVLTQNQITALNNLAENINSNTSKILLSKNEVTYEVNQIKKLKSNLQKNKEPLATRYVRLSNALDTRYSYYANISACTDQLYRMFLEFETTLPQKHIENKINLDETNKIVKKLAAKEKLTLEEELTRLQKQAYENNFSKLIENENVDITINQTEINYNTANNQENPQEQFEQDALEQNAPEAEIEQQEIVDGFQNNATPKIEVSNEEKQTNLQSISSEPSSEPLYREVHTVEKIKNSIEPLPTKTYDKKIRSFEERVKSLRKNKTSANQSFNPTEEEHFTSSDFPFKTPKKYDFMKII